MIRNKAVLEAFVKNLARGLSDLEKKKLALEIKRCIDDRGSLYLRLDKQEALLGRMRLRKSDPIRIKIKLSMSRKSLKEIINYYRSLNLV